MVSAECASLPSNLTLFFVTKEQTLSVILLENFYNKLQFSLAATRRHGLKITQHLGNYPMVKESV
jgi:hypothetical protein